MNPQLMVALVALAFGVVAIASVVWAGRGRHLGRRRYRNLSELGQDLERRCGLRATVSADGWFAPLSNVALAGELENGRPARLGFEVVSRGRHGTYERVCFGVRAPDAPWLAIRRKSLIEKVGGWLGWTKNLETGDRGMDGRFLIQTSSDEQALVAFARGLKDEVRRAFEVHSIEALEVVNGWLVAAADSSAIQPEDYPRLLDLLDRAAQSFERTPIQVRVLGAERRAFVAEGATRCAYCHAGISGAEPDLVACPRCHTVLHDGCWSENGHCPVLGCAERTPERARAGPST